MTDHSATYSPDDNKLRLYPAYRLPKDEYDRLKAHGFKWAPKQELFVAPMWTPDREDLLIEMAGEIGDEDKSLMERQEERADRFIDYRHSREQDADRAHRAVKAIADNIPFGQPILIGHHSERHARRDAEKIRSGMEKAVRMWDTAQYWKERAAGALAHAKYKELPAVRARRIKGLEADQRKTQKTKDEAELKLKLWSQEGLTLEKAVTLAGFCHFDMPRKEGDRPDFNQCPSAHTALTGDYPSLYAPRTLEEVIERAKAIYPRTIARCDRWLTHYANRLEYERAMLAEAGGLVSDRQKFEIGGQVLRRGQWFLILKVNPTSVSVRGHFATTITFDEIQDYQPPKPGDTEKVKAATKLPPMCNYPGDGFRHMTREEWENRKMSDCRQSITLKATETTGAHRVRATWGKDWTTDKVFLTDEPRKDPPALLPIEAPQLPERNAPEPRTYTPRPAPEPTPFDAMRDSLKAGIQTVSAPQLFPTPPAIAAQMVERAELKPEHRILEPSGGTGRILLAIKNAVPNPDLTAVEVKPHLANIIRSAYRVPTYCGDFLEQNGNLGTFDRIVMNPPFSNGDDIKHILHARHFLNPGGRLVALCANGPRQQDQLRPLATTWEELPEGSFAEAGTNVRVVMLTMDADERV